MKRVLLVFFLLLCSCQLNAAIPSQIFESVNVVTGKPDNPPKYVTIELYDDKNAPDEFSIGKVYKLVAPIGLGYLPLTKNRFVYHKDSTEIFDCLGNKTEYKFENGQIAAIIIYDEKDHPYRKDEYYWKTVNGKPQLICEAVSDRSGTIHSCQTYAYNANGKITKETLYGNLSGKNSAPILLSEEKVPLDNGVERYSVTFDYSHDNPELCISQIEDNQNKKLYHYYPNTNLIKAKFICDKDLIKARHFFYYDADENLSKTIVDDGQSIDADDLTNVKHRWIEKNTYLKDSKEPNTQEQLYWDVKSQREKLYKFTNIYKESSGNCIKEITDAKGRATKEVFDAQGRQLSLVESNGKTVTFEYDENGNVKTMTQSENDGIYQATFTYDSCDQLIMRKEVFKNGMIIQTTLRLDGSGNPLVLEDINGNRTYCDYDIYNRLVKTTYPPIGNELGKNQSIEKMEYDIFNHVTMLENEKGQKTFTKYNVRGKPIEISFAEGMKETFEYYLDGSIAKYTTNDGLTTTYENDFLARPQMIERYDADGKLIDTSHYDYSTFHFLNQVVSQNENEESKEESALNDVQETCIKFYHSIKDAARSIYNHYSFDTHAYTEAEQVGLDIFGKTFLSLSGFYVDHMEKGEYGEVEMNDKIRITAINGILNLRSICIENVDALSKAHGNAKVHYVFYPSEGWTKDILKAAMAKFGYVGPQAKLLAETWKNLIQEMGGTKGGGLIIHYAHSIGGTNTMIAKDLLTPEEQKMIRVVTVGSSTLIPNEGFDSVINFVSLRDGVTQFTDPIGYFKGLLTSENNIVYVGTHYGVPFIDHLLNQETYARVMQMLGEDFQKAHNNRSQKSEDGSQKSDI